MIANLKINFLSKSRSFTLIELLVVLAIMGILSGTLMIYWWGTVTKAKDARIIEEMSQIRNAAAIYYSSNEYSFENFDCTIVISQLNMPALCDDITKQGGKNFEINVNPPNEYCAKVQLNSGAWWCIDTKGRSAMYDASTTPTEPTCTGGASPVYTCE
jgi:prepilin-type N-terminal cleavage/methylation domain-containing protein